MNGIDLAALALIAGDDPRLDQACEPWAFDGDGDPMPLIARLVGLATECNGVGLAAPQIGVMRRVFVMRSISAPAHRADWVVIINPQIAELNPEKTIEREGCLSWPGLFLKIERSRGVRASWSGPDGKPYHATFDGQMARCFLHEFDHLEGRTLKTVAPGSFAIAERALAKTPARG